MATTATRMSRVSLNGKGVPVIEGTRMKVAQLVAVQRAWNLSPEALQEQFPHLSLGQIHAALAYYYDHQDEIDADIEQREREVSTLEAQGRKNQPSARELLDRARQRGVDPATITRYEGELDGSSTTKDGAIAPSGNPSGNGVA